MFDTTLLNAQPGRYTLIAESILPPLGIFILGGLFLRPTNAAGKNVHGRPKGFIFGLIWFLLTAMWLLALVIVAMNTVDLTSLILIGVFSFVSFVCCMLWLWFYKYNQHSTAAQILLLGFATSLATTVLTLASETPTDPKLVSSLFFSLITAWLSCASLLAYLELNI